MKRSDYKYQIEQELLSRDWEIIEIGSNQHWWDDEHWRIQLKYNPRISFFLCFIVDPQFNQPRKKGQGIYQVLASTEFPNNWNDDNTKISTINMTKRKFSIKIEEFTKDLENFKKEKMAK